MPLTFLDFPKEIVHVPREVAELAFADIERWETPDYGGHFPALEVPDVLVDSLRALQPIAEDMTLSSLAPRGVSSFTVCPTRAPRSALPTGESIESRPSPGEASDGDTSS